jgi:hypothetical protein
MKKVEAYNEVWYRFRCVDYQRGHAKVRIAK